MLELINEQRAFAGMQKRYQHQSQVTNGLMTFSIYLPEKAIHGEACPVLYWLSGLTCTDENFVSKAGAQRVANECGLIIVCPDTSPRGEGVSDREQYDLGQGAGFYVNATEAPWASHFKMYDYVSKELPSLIAKEFPVTDKCSISGHSMGGHGALTIGLRNPSQYYAISAFAPICHPSDCPWGTAAFNTYLGSDKQNWEKYDSVALMQQVDHCPPIMISQGAKDEFLEHQLKPQSLLDVANEKGFTVNYELHKGYDHSYFFIASFIESHLRFHHRQLTD